MKRKVILKRVSRGFTLVELAIVLIIVAMLTGGMLFSLTTTRDISLANDTRAQLASINDALLGFAAVNGRLPCPASPTSNGVESFCTNDLSAACGAELLVPPAHGVCRNPFDGFVPARTLGIGPVDDQGYAVDAWGNRIGYAISNVGDAAFNFVFTGNQRIRAAWAAPPAPNGDLQICSTADGMTGAFDTADCQTVPTATLVADRAVAVIYSRGTNGAVVPSTDPDEAANGDNDRLFVSKTRTPTYDDIVVWVSPNILYNRMISAGQLP